MNRASCLEKRYRRGEPGLLRAHAYALVLCIGGSPGVAPHRHASHVATSYATSGCTPHRSPSAYARAMEWNAETQRWQVRA